MVDLDQAREFLMALGTPPFVFQTFTDSKVAKKALKGKRDPLARVIIGTFDECAWRLQGLSDQGAGIFVQINEGCNRGADHITGVRALFLDLDRPETKDASFKSMAKYMPKPSILVKSSPGKCHVYWTVADCPIDKFSTLQHSLALTFAADVQIKNLDRVMRVPGFAHKKVEGEEHLVKGQVIGGVHATLKLVRAASNAPVMAAPINQAPVVAKTDDVFGMHLSPAYQAPTVLAPGDRTHKLVSHAGHLVSQGFSAEYVRKELQELNVALCPAGEEPISGGQLEGEVLGAVDRFIEARDIDEEVHATPEPVLQLAPPPPVLGLLATPPPPPVEVQEVTDKEEHSLEKWLDRFLYVEDGSRIIDKTRRGSHAIYQFQEFQRKYANVFVGAEGKMHAKWQAHPRRQDVRSTIYVPSTDKIIPTQGVNMWNTYHPSDILPADELDITRVEPFARHIEMLFPNTKDREIFWDWMAMTITRPEIRIPWAPLLVSAQGAGKGFIYQTMSKMMGEHNCNMIIADRLESQFNSFIAGSTLVCLDEMKFSAKYGVSDKLKNLISERTIEVNTKNTKEYIADVFANILIFSNHISGTYVETGDRRFWVHRIDAVPEAEHFEQMWDWLADETNVSHMLTWIQRRDIKGFKYASHPPMTDAKREMIEAGKTQLEICLEDAISNKEGPFAADVIGWKTLEAFAMESTGETRPGAIERTLKNIWNRVSVTMPTPVARATIGVGKQGRVRVRCVRNARYWTQATMSDISHEATRAAQMLLTPNDVSAPLLRAVK